jgi:two-component system, NarL family, nitrate/nitrite response regulator NarL
MKLVLAYPHRLLIESLAAALARHGVAVAALAISPAEVLAAVAAHQPDICLLGAGLRGSNGVDVLQVIGTRYPAVRVVMLSAGPDPGLTAAASAAGAAGLIAEDCHLDELVRVLARIWRGEHVFAAALPGTMAAGPRSNGRCSGSWPPPVLTPREQDVVLRMVEGECTRQIACSLSISDATVRTHVQNVLAKLGVHSRLEAIAAVAGPGCRLSGAPGHRTAVGGG